MSGPGRVYIDAVLASPPVYLDGMLLCEDNKLNPNLDSGGYALPEHQELL